MNLNFYKKGQGYYTRLCTALGTGIISALGCYALYDQLGAITSLDAATKNWVQAGVPFVFMLVLAWLIFKALNKPSIADFMISTEGEMKKVSWSSRKEIIASTKVVIVTVILMASLLAVVDWGFASIFKKIGILKMAG